MLVPFTKGALAIVGDKYAFQGTPGAISFLATKALSFLVKASGGTSRKFSLAVDTERDAADWVRVICMVHRKCAEGEAFENLAASRDELLALSPEALREAT